MIPLSVCPLLHILTLSVHGLVIVRCARLRQQLGGMRLAWLWWTRLSTSCRVDASTLSSSLRVCSRRPRTAPWMSVSANTQYFFFFFFFFFVATWMLTCTVIHVKVAVEDACDSSTSIGTYVLLLHSYEGRTMLEFQVRYKTTANIFSSCATIININNVLLGCNIKILQSIQAFWRSALMLSDRKLCIYNWTAIKAVLVSQT